MTVHSAQRNRLSGASELLRDLAEHYYLGCKAYHICTQTGSPERRQWHVRLKTLAQIGNRLADVLHETRPNWKILFHTAHRYRQLDHNPFHTPTPAAPLKPPTKPPAKTVRSPQPALRKAVARARLRVVQ